MNPTTTFIADYIGKLAGIFLVAVFINFLIRKLTKREGILYQIVSVIVSTTLYIVIPSNILRNIETAETITAWNFISFYCGVVVFFLFWFKVRLRFFLLILFWGIVAFLPITFLRVLLPFYSQLEGPSILLSCLIISLLLVRAKILPWTKF